MNDQQGYLKQAQNIILSNKEAAEYAVFLYGSRARGTHNEVSDIDIGILGKQKMPAILKLTIEEQLENSNIPLRMSVTDFFNGDVEFKKQALSAIQIWNLPKDIVLNA